MLNLRELALWAALCGSLCLLLSPRALAQDAEPQAYRTTIDDAVREFSSGHWEEARALFKRAHEVLPNARTLRGMGMAAFEMRMYTAAIRELDAALRDTRKPLEGDLRAQVSRLMVKAREFVGRVKLELEPPEARLLIDGKEPEFEPDGSVLLDVGTHVISANADRYKPTNLRMSVEGGMESTVRVPLEPLITMQAGVPAIDPNKPPPEAAAPPPPPPERHEQSHLDTIAWVALAGAAAFGITGGVMYFVVGQGKYADVEDQKAQAINAGECGLADVDGTFHCPKPLIEGFIDESGVKTADTLATVFLVAAGASAVTSGVLFAIYAGSDSGETAAAAAAPRVNLAFSPAGVSLRGQF